MEKDITNEELEKVSKNIDKLLFVDLLMWRNQMIERGKVNNRLYHLIDNEVNRRSAEIYQHEIQKSQK